MQAVKLGVVGLLVLNASAAVIAVPCLVVGTKCKGGGVNGCADLEACPIVNTAGVGQAGREWGNSMEVPCKRFSTDDTTSAPCSAPPPGYRPPFPQYPGSGPLDRCNASSGPNQCCFVKEDKPGIDLTEQTVVPTGPACVGASQ